MISPRWSVAAGVAAAVHGKHYAAVGQKLNVASSNHGAQIDPPLIDLEDQGHGWRVVMGLRGDMLYS